MYAIPRQCSLPINYTVKIIKNFTMANVEVQKLNLVDISYQWNLTIRLASSICFSTFRQVQGYFWQSIGEFSRVKRI